ncbi:SDR family oxidoreductase [Streptomyces globisporus]|uniref:SDR family oxidoreductase n=1 Tax=Streptomyces globisporus TaxID=1908 RepID=UPI0038646B50|nr:SDR family oxidoreductase [Streptomyces globisporus]
MSATPGQELTRRRGVDHHSLLAELRCGKTGSRVGASLRRIEQREEATSVVFFLASEDASYVSGQTLYIDAGAR